MHALFHKQHKHTHTHIHERTTEWVLYPSFSSPPSHLSPFSPRLTNLISKSPGSFVKFGPCVIKLFSIWGVKEQRQRCQNVNLS